MFWKRSEPHISHDRAVELREALADRLRLALDFATLGAYELTEPDHDGGATDGDRAPRPAGSRQAPSSEVDHETRGCPRTARSRERARPHVRAASLPCPAGRKVGDEHGDCAGRRDAKTRRGGSVQVAQQPCTWAGS